MRLTDAYSADRDAIVRCLGAATYDGLMTTHARWVEWLTAWRGSSSAVVEYLRSPSHSLSDTYLHLSWQPLGCGHPQRRDWLRAPCEHTGSGWAWSRKGEVHAEDGGLGREESEGQSREVGQTSYQVPHAPVHTGRMHVHQRLVICIPYLQECLRGSSTDCRPSIPGRDGRR